MKSSSRLLLGLLTSLLLSFGWVHAAEYTHQLGTTSAPQNSSTELPAPSCSPCHWNR